MDNEIKIFENERFGEKRTAGTSEEPLFCLVDVCKAIGIKDVSRCASRLDDDMRLTHPIVDSLGRTQQATFVTESGLYDVIIRSDSEMAKPFCKWITSEVLPSIRKTENTPIEENLSGKNTTGLCLPGKYDSRRGLNSLCKPRVAIATTKP